MAHIGGAGLIEGDHGGGKGAAAPENNFPERYVIFGVGVGLFLVLLGTAILFFGRNQVASSLTICVGFGLVLAAFGARVSGSWAGWSVTGAGAMAVLLFLVLQYYSPVGVTQFLKGEIGGDFSRVAELRLIDDEPMYLYRDTQVRRYKFLGMEKALKSSRMRVQVDTTENEPGKEFFEMVGDTKTIVASFEDGRPIQWKFDYGARQVKDGNTVLFSVPDTISPLASAGSGGLDDEALGSFFAGVAHAQASLSSVNPEQVNAALEGLRSDDLFVRRNARDLLASAGVDAVPVMLQRLRSMPDDDRLMQGVVFALAEMVRSKEVQPSDISAKLVSQDFAILVDAAADEDRSVRHQAAEVLYALEDPRAVQFSLEAAKQATDPGVANNQILILRQAGSQLPKAQKGDITRQLKDPQANLNKAFQNRVDVDGILKW